jgi:hypothetical protein
MSLPHPAASLPVTRGVPDALWRESSAVQANRDYVLPLSLKPAIKPDGA